MFAGRNISATHAAISSRRVMATCSLLGQAMGTAASICARDGITPREVYTTGKYREVQKILMEDGCYLPGLVREVPELSKNASINLTDSDTALLFNGIERPDENMTVNYATLNIGDALEFDFGEEKELSELRLVFDPDFSRESISVNKKMKVFTQVSSRGKDFRPVKVANTLVKSFSVYADGKLVWVNSIIYDCRAQLAARHSDDTAIAGDCEFGWGWLADKGYDMIQTDWALMLINYLKESGKYYK